MLTADDIAWIKGNRREITQNRTFDITLYGETETGKHPITGEPVTQEVTEQTIAVVTEITSAFKLDRDLIDGVEVEEGDIWVDIDTADLSLLSAKEIVYIDYNDDNYTVLAADLVGLGDPNRVTIVGRLTG